MIRGEPTNKVIQIRIGQPDSLRQPINQCAEIESGQLVAGGNLQAAVVPLNRKSGSDPSVLIAAERLCCASRPVIYAPRFTAQSSLE